MKIPKICNWYKIIPVTYKIGKSERYDYPHDIDVAFGFEIPVVHIIEYQIQKKFLFWWYYITKDKYIVNFKNQDDAVNYVIHHNKGRSVNLIRA